MNVSITESQSEQTQDVADILARAFYDDPLHRFLFPGQRRMDVLRSYFKASISDAMRHGKVLVAGGLQGTGGAAILLPAQAHPLSLPRLLKFTPTAVKAAFYYPSRAVKIVKSIGMIEGVHKRYEHAYLSSIGVEANCRGQGVGGKLLDAVFDYSEGLRQAIFLETWTAANRDWYQRHGFDVVEEVALPAPGPTGWAMLQKEPNYG